MGIFQSFYSINRPPKYETIFQPGMNCNFEADNCVWELFPKPNLDKVSEFDGAAAIFIIIELYSINYETN